MNKTQQLRDLGQSLWLDNITRHFGEIGGRHPREPFAEEPSRGERFAAEAAGLVYLDYSKQRITGDTLSLLWETRA